MILIRILLPLLLLLFATPIAAQRKEITVAKEQLKSKKNVDKAEASMRKLLADSTMKQRDKAWQILYEALEIQYAQTNEKLYLKQTTDTMALFNITKRLFDAAMSIDSMEMEGGKNGKADLKFRRKHSDDLMRIRTNLFNGGAFQIRKAKYDDAYTFFNTYVDAVRQPLFRSYKLAERDTLLPRAAYYAAFCAYMMHDTKATLHHAYWALKDKSQSRNMLQYLAETYRQENDMLRYRDILAEGFEQYPNFPYFYSRLVDYYRQTGSADSALVVTNKALETDSLNTLYIYTKSSLLLNAGQFEQSIELAKQVIAADSTMAEAWLNAGIGYYNQAVRLDKNIQSLRKNRTKIEQYYRSALPYLEHYRQLAPKETTKWGYALYTIYLNLNMGKEFDEIDELLKQKQ